jgi:rhodanese-related sulfurtransferase
VALEVDRDTFTAAHADGVLVIDAREPSEYAGGHVPGAWLRPTWASWSPARAHLSHQPLPVRRTNP